MDATDIFAIAVVVTITGTIFAVILGIITLLGSRRIALSERLIETTGNLHQIALEERQGGRGTHYWIIRSQYDYLAGGQTMKGTRAALEFNSFNSQAKALKVIGDLRPGQKVTVWYDPRNSKTAVLNRAPPANLKLYRVLAIIGVFLSIGGAIAVALTVPGTISGAS